jgi:hypothetical protein
MSTQQHQSVERVTSSAASTQSTAPHHQNNSMSWHYNQLRKREKLRMGRLECEDFYPGMEPIKFECLRCKIRTQTNSPNSMSEYLKPTFSIKWVSLFCEKCRPNRRTNWVRMGGTAIDYDGNEVMLNLDLYREECGKIQYEVIDHIMRNIDELTALERSLPQQLAEYTEERKSMGKEVWVERKPNGERRDNLFWSYKDFKG